jgi:hypothetical protein
MGILGLKHVTTKVTCNKCVVGHCLLNTGFGEDGQRIRLYNLGWRQIINIRKFYT